MSTQLELPVEARLLIPLLTAWREAPAELDKNTRAKIVGDRMRELEASFKDQAFPNPQPTETLTLGTSP